METELPSSFAGPGPLMLATMMNIQLPRFQTCAFPLRLIASVLCVYRQVVLGHRRDEDK